MVPSKISQSRGIPPLVFQLVFILALVLSPSAGLAAAPPGSEEEGSSWLDSIGSTWGGHLKIRGSLSGIDDESLYGIVEPGTYYDGAFDGRLTNRTFLSDQFYLEAHYELLFSGGDTRKTQSELLRRIPRLFSNAPFLTPNTDDDRRFMDLTHLLRDRDDHTLTHRLDRLLVSWSPDPFVIKAGRQAVTWGSGFLFNPMDLVNPFAPTDIERDYKIGDDMISLRFPLTQSGDAELLYVPRRSLETGGVSWNESSLAAKVRFSLGGLELDVLSARHYRDAVVGLGATGYAGNTAWRMDATWTFLDRKIDQEGFLSLVANVDYSWVWWGKNFYGFLEFFYCGLGEGDPGAALMNSQLMARLERGELFTLGRAYLAGHVKFEPHPLFNILLTVIHRTREPSGLIQPRMTWDATTNVQITLGGSLPYGARGTEFAGYTLPGTDFLSPAPAHGFVWVTYYF